MCKARACITPTITRTVDVAPPRRSHSAQLLPVSAHDHDAVERGRARHWRRRGRSHCGAHTPPRLPVSTALSSKRASTLETASSLDETVRLRCRSSWPLSSSAGSAPELTHVLYEASLSSVDVGGARRSAVRRDYPPGVRLELCTNVCEKSDLHVVSVTVV